MAKFIQSSLEELFTNRRYMAIFYLVGTLVLGSIGAAIDSGKATTHSAMWFIVFLVIPLHFVLYACKKFPAWFIEKSITRELEFYQSFLTAYGGETLKQEERLKFIAALAILHSHLKATITALLLFFFFGTVSFFYAEERVPFGVLMILLAALYVWIHLHKERLLKTALDSSLFHRYREHSTGIIPK